MLSGGICCVSAAGKDCMGRGQRGELLPLRQRRAAGTVVAFLVTGRMPRLAASPSHPCRTSTGTLLPISPAHPIPHSYEEGTNLSRPGRTSPYRPPQCARELGWLGMPEGEVRAQHDDVAVAVALPMHVAVSWWPQPNEGCRSSMGPRGHGPHSCQECQRLANPGAHQQGTCLPLPLKQLRRYLEEHAVGGRCWRRMQRLSGSEWGLAG